MQQHPQAMLFVRAELGRRLDRLRAMATPAPSREFRTCLHELRRLAAGYGLAPAARLARAFERALDDGVGERGAALYFDRLSDAIGCERLDDKASEALLASVSVRFDA